MEGDINALLGGISMPGLPKRMVASGGIARGLIRALHPDGDKALHAYELDYAVRTAQGLSIDALTRRFNVKQKRAQSLLPGGTVYRAILRHFGLESMVVSEFGVREGLIMEAAAAS